MDERKSLLTSFELIRVGRKTTKTQVIKPIFPSETSDCVQVPACSRMVMTVTRRGAYGFYKTEDGLVMRRKNCKKDIKIEFRLLVIPSGRSSHKNYKIPQHFADTKDFNGMFFYFFSLFR